MKTVRVRIAVAVDSLGGWAAIGYHKDDNPFSNIYVDELAHGEARYWVEADLPVPEVATVEGSVTRAEEN